MNLKVETAKRLLAVNALKAITGTRIYRGNRLPRNQALQPPHIIIWQISKTPHYDHDGYTGLTDATLQISCFSPDPDQADTMAGLVRQSMESWPAEIDDIDSVFLEDESENFEYETLIHHIALDLAIAYHEVVYHEGGKKQ